MWEMGTDLRISIELDDCTFIERTLYMARKLTEGERNTINFLTASFVAALPAHLRSHAGSIASSLVRIPREVITARDINRIVGRLGEDAGQKEELRDAIREVALVSTGASEGDPESFTLRGPEDEPAWNRGRTPVQPTEPADPEPAPVNGGRTPVQATEAADSEPAPSDAAATEDSAKKGDCPAEEPKPAKRRHRRRVGDRGGHLAEQEAASKQQEAEAETEADAVTEPAADSAPDAEPAAAEPAASPAAGDAAAPAPEKKRRRTRRSRKKPAQVEAEPAVEESQVDAADEPVAATEPVPEVAPAEPAVDAEAADSDAVDSDAAAPAETDAAAEPADAEPADAADDQPAADVASAPADVDATPAPEADAVQRPARNGRYRGRRGGQNNGGNPKLQGKNLDQVPYIRRGGQTEADLRARIVQLDQRFWMNGWLLSHPGAFELYEKELLALNEFLVSGTVIGDITRRQLAYQMGGDEKFFEYGSDGFRLLRSMGVEDLIRHRPLPKPDLLYHAPRRRKHMRVLVTENLDPWLDVRDLMYEEGVSQILGERIHAVVLGGGMPVLEPNRLHLLLDTLGADSYDVLYWGDIDRAGLDILLKLQALLDGKFEVKAFTPAYQLMCDRAMARFPEPGDNEKTGQINLEVGDTSVICDGLTPEAAAYAKAVIDGCCLIPQEILTKRDL